MRCCRWTSEKCGRSEAGWSLSARSPLSGTPEMCYHRRGSYLMRIAFLILCVFMITGSAVLADFEPFPLKTAGLIRTISGVENIIKTTELQIGDLKTMDGPSLDFMIELDWKGENLILVPSDFTIQGVGSETKNQEIITSVELRCKVERFPLVVYIDYIRNPKAAYQAKSITIPPRKNVKGAVIRRVTTESVQFKSDLAPLSTDASGFGSDYKRAFAVVQQKSGKGVCFGATAGKAAMDRPRRFSVYEETETPAELGWKSGRVWFCAVSGTPGEAFRTYRQMLLDTRYPALAKDTKLVALKTRLPASFASCRYLPASGTVDAEGYIADNKGFIFLFNTASASAKTVLPLSDPGMKLSGDLKLSDWTTLDKPVDMGVKKLDENVELDVDARGYRIIGVNVE